MTRDNQSMFRIAQDHLAFGTVLEWWTLH